MYPNAPPAKRKSTMSFAYGWSCAWIILKGSWVCCVVVWPVLMLVVVTDPFLAVMVIFGSKPKNENCASFWGPSIDSSRYAVWYFLCSLENISMGWFV